MFTFNVRIEIRVTLLMGQNKYDTHAYRRSERLYLTSDPDLKAVRDQNDEVDFTRYEISLKRLFAWVRRSFGALLKR